MKQAHIFISGRVHGVGYRFFVKATARDLNLPGWVRNTEDGGVEVVVQGMQKEVEQLIEACKKGPFLSEVKQVGYEWEAGEEQFTEFKIL